MADLKLLADALFAQGVNQVVWHGMPFNGPGGRNEFYASVHVGPDAAFAAELPAFNAYLERVSSLLRLGRTESRLAVYLPNEDNRRLDRIPDAERTPGAMYRWEMRHVVVPREAEGYAPLWISAAFLGRAEVGDGRLRVGDCAFSALADRRRVARRRRPGRGRPPGRRGTPRDPPTPPAPAREAPARRLRDPARRPPGPPERLRPTRRAGSLGKIETRRP